MWHVWSRGHCCHAVTRDEEIIFTRAPVQRSKSAVCGAGWLGDHSDHWSGLACLNWSWLVAITINVSTSWKYHCQNWWTLVITHPGCQWPEQRRYRAGCAGGGGGGSAGADCWLLTSSTLTRTIRNTNLGHAHLSLHIDVVTFYFLFTLDYCNFPISHQPIGVKINISDQ